MFFSFDYTFRKDDVVSTLATFLDETTLDFAKAQSITLAPGLRPELRFAPLARGLSTRE